MHVKDKYNNQLLRQNSLKLLFSIYVYVYVFIFTNEALVVVVDDSAVLLLIPETFLKSWLMFYQ